MIRLTLKSWENMMAYIQIGFLCIAAIATVLFVLGYIRGTREALATYNEDAVETDDRGDVEAYWWQIGLAVVASVAVIALAGVAPFFIYLGPLLSIITAGMIGVAFFVDARRRTH
jgi:hypothetical protein